ncbi:tRNA (guanine(37)-N1)-methyltransferase Trm5b [Candidatus Bilamarchaeum dharawalense]|uniref:tRNA (guanine(37)-N(1))-methyltransferase n=1 Tax=Candidatus Bilamarchaeum dharawalense TaxID=2885759 RepID=A0A5E4LR10_9ARCH|nr:tRNA (guanine(37)-N1)-methyltransferase Trm5b [Candidatus Bilamarchaeum dharawalense]
MKFLKVPKKQAEKIRKELADENSLSLEYSILKDGDFVLFPILSSKNKKFEIVELQAEKRLEPHGKLKDALSKIFSSEELENLVASFDIIGDIAIIEVPDALTSKELEIGDTVLKIHRNVKTVLKKLGPMEGEFRVRQLSHIAGEKKTETIYKESGALMKLDVAKVYFSVRLAYERTRIAELIRPGEKILVLFAGVGPFALVFAKKHPDAEIVAVELNPVAVSYMRQNIELNRLKNVEAMECDAHKFSGKDFDRVVMPLPKTGHEFLNIAFASVKNGGIIHFYTWSESEDPFVQAMEKAQTAASQSKVAIEFENMRIVRPYAPNIVQVVLDLKKL